MNRRVAEITDRTLLVLVVVLLVAGFVRAEFKDRDLAERNCQAIRSLARALEISVEADPAPPVRDGFRMLIDELKARDC